MKAQHYGSSLVLQQGSLIEIINDVSNVQHMPQNNIEIVHNSLVKVMLGSTRDG